MKHLRTATLLLTALAASLAGCSSGNDAAAPLPSGAAPSPAKTSAPAAAKTTAVTVNLKIPARTAQSSRRQPAYVSPSTLSAAVLVNGVQAAVFSTGAGSPNCTGSAGSLVCSASVAAPIGADTFTLQTYDGAPAGGAASGTLLSTGSAGATIVANRANAVNLALSGVVSSLSVSAASVPAGVATSVPVVVDAKDPDGNTIVGSGGYVDAGGNAVTVTLADSDPSNTTTLSATSVSGPGTSIVLQYSGTPPYGKMPSLSATEGTIASAPFAFDILPSTSTLPAMLTGRADGGMALGTDGNLYLLETQTNYNGSSGNRVPIVAKVSPTDGSVSEFTYAPCGAGKPLGNAPQGFAASPNGNVYFGTYNPCGTEQSGSYQGELIGMTPGGSFSSTEVNLGPYAYLEAAYTLAFGSSGTAYMDADVNCCNATTAASQQSGESFATSSANGSGTYYDFLDALGYTDDATNNYYFNGGSSRGALDPSNTLYLYGDIQTIPVGSPPTDRGTNRYVIVKANTAGASAYTLPSSSGTYDNVAGMTVASDGNLWYCAVQRTLSEGESAGIVIGKMTPSGTFAEYPVRLPNGASPNLCNAAVVDGADDAIYTFIQDSSGGIYVLRADRSGLITVEPSATLTSYQVGQFGYGVRTSNGNIYVDTSAGGIVQILY